MIMLHFGKNIALVNMFQVKQILLYLFSLKTVKPE